MLKKGGNQSTFGINFENPNGIRLYLFMSNLETMKNCTICWICLISIWCHVFITGGCGDGRVYYWDIGIPTGADYQAKSR